MLSRAFTTIVEKFPLYEFMCAIVLCAAVYATFYAAFLFALCRSVSEYGLSCF